MRDAITRRIYGILWNFGPLLPIDGRKIIVVSYYGRGYSDNPKAVVSALYDIEPRAKVYWAVKNVKYTKGLPGNIRPVRLNSLAYIYHMLTSRVWIDNSRKPSYEKKRNGQLYVQVWHSNNARLKKVERDAGEKLSQIYIRSAKQDASQTDVMVSGSQFNDNCFRQAFWYPDGEILKVGSPRNDIFFNDPGDIVNKVHRELGIDMDTRIVLYAPTFRMDHSLDTYFLNFQKIVRGFEDQFGGEWKLALRLHPNVAKESENMGLKKIGCVIDATNYDDMQELLVASNALITDYSSSVFDYILTKRPTFILASDYADYIQERGVYFDLRRLPFSYSETEEGLLDSIKNFDEAKYAKKSEAFMKKYKFYDNGKASVATAKWIIDKLDL